MPDATHDAEPTEPPEAAGGGPVVPAVLYEDDHLLAVDKPAGLVTHPAYKHPNGTLCDAIFARQCERGESRPWLLHRLDRETSGIVLFAKSVLARRALVRQFERRTVRKQYLAVVVGIPEPPAGTIDAPLARDPADRRRTIVDAVGQAASTDYRVLAADNGYALVLAEPRTGRTHQIRAHLASIGTPLIGDARYLPVDCAAGLAPRAMLHAWRLGFLYPSTGAPHTLCAPVPGDMLVLAHQLGLSTAVEHLNDCL